MNTSATSTTKAPPALEDISEQIGALRAEINKFATTVTEDMSEGIDRAGKQIRRTGQEVGTTATRAVLDHPLAAIGVATAVGFLLAMTMRKS